MLDTIVELAGGGLLMVLGAGAKWVHGISADVVQLQTAQKITTKFLDERLARIEKKLDEAIKLR